MYFIDSELLFITHCVWRQNLNELLQPSLSNKYTLKHTLSYTDTSLTKQTGTNRLLVSAHKSSV